MAPARESRNFVKMMCMKILLFSLFLMAAMTASSQADNSFGPHKGRVYAYMNYRVEVLGCNEFIEVYIYNKDMQALNNFGATGDVKFYYQNQTYVSAPLTAFGSDGFTARIPSTDFSYARLTLMIDGQPVSVKFGNECIVGVSISRD